MKKTNTILLAVTLALSAILLPSLTLINVSYALPGPRIYLTPSDNTFYTNETSVGYRFNVTVSVENTTDLDVAGAQIYMEFNDSIVNVTRWFVPAADPDFFMPSPYAALPTPPDAGYIHLPSGLGCIKIAVSKGGLPPVAPWGHDGKIAIIEFVIKAAPTSGAFNCALHIDTIDTFLLDPLASEIPNVTKEDGTYTYTYVAIPVTGHIWLETVPSSYTADRMRPFNITVMIYNVSASDGLIGVQFELRYNSTYLEPIAIYQGTFLNNSAWAQHGTIATFYHEEDRTVYGEMILPNGTGEWNPPFPEGNGTMAIVTFLPQLHESIPPSWAFDINLTPLFGQYLLDHTGEYMPYQPEVDCSYAFDPLPLPTVSIEPSLYTAAQVGEEFTIDVEINDLDAGWQFVYAEFKLMYGENVLEVLDVTEGSFLEGFGTTTFNYELGAGYVKVNITLTPTAEYPSGGGILASILFNVTKTPGRCPLTLDDTVLLDPEDYAVLHDVSHGYYRLHEVLIHPIVWGTVTYNVVTVSNASITPVPMLFTQTHRMLNFNVTDEDGMVGFVDVTIPNVLLNAGSDEWLLIVGGSPVTPTVTGNLTHTTLSFYVSLSTKSVYLFGTGVIPEFPLNALLLVFFALTLAGFAAVKLARKNELVALLKQ
ncbi:MAG: cohesin domain-containing protein [Candidatus Bathyarchaeota archaeon]|nr:cohesin domain-containing protein [Candidatus Bathyarchaeota archaeon]